MSGSTRAITLTLSVRDADSVKRTLEGIGPAGEQALARLEAAAQKAAGRSGGGGMRQLADATQQVGSQFRGAGQTITQAGFQLQDFFVQVQSGTSALTALSQQGSQFLGIFGAGGAVAGAALAIGTLAAGLLTGSRNAEAFKNSEESLAAAFRASREVVEALIVSTRNLANERRNAAIQEVQVEVGRARLAQDRIEAERRSIRGENELARRAAGGALDQGLVVQNQQRIDELNQRAQRAGELAERLQQELDNLTNLRRFDRLRDPRADENGYGDLDAMRAAAREAAEKAQREAEAARRRAEAEARRGAAATRREERLDERSLRERNQLISSLDEEAAANIRLEESLKRIDEARRRNQLSEEEATRYSQLARSRREQDIVRANDKSALDREALKETEALTRDVGNTFTSAFEEAIVKGNDLRKVLNGVAEDLARIILRQSVVNPLGNAATGLINAGARAVSGMFGGGTGGYTAEASGVGMVKSALGNAFANGRLIPFASGGMVDRATVVPMALMGEAGPEAIMPLRRGKDGKLGVAAQGSGGGGVVNNFTIDARGADPSVVPLIRAGVEEAVRRSQAEFLASIQRGGQAAKIVGRRS